MTGWELDAATAIVVSNFMGIGSLTGSGALTAHVGDALADDAVVEGGFAGLIVDLFSEAALLPAVAEDETWFKLQQRLKPDGIVMVNLGALPLASDMDQGTHPSVRALNAMSKAFGGAHVALATRAVLADCMPRKAILSKRAVCTTSSDL